MSKRKIFGLSLIVVLAVIWSLVIFFRERYVVPILMYHSITSRPEPKNMLAVSVGAFQRQMIFLKENNYHILPLGRLAELMREKRRLPYRAIAITFDDGYKNVYTNAFPILKKYNIPATLFIIVNEVGRPQNDRLSWDEINQMQKSGIIAFGSHTLGPEPLINLKSQDEIKRQIFDSKRILEEKLGSQVTLFSYPEGRFDVKIRQLVIAAGYKAAVTTDPGSAYPDADVFALKRLRISQNCSNLFIFGVESSGFYTFFKEHRHR